MRHQGLEYLAHFHAFRRPIGRRTGFQSCCAQALCFLWILQDSADRIGQGQDGRTFKQGDFVREQPLGTRRAVADHGNAASHELERQQRQIGEGQDQADIALRVQGRQICQIDDAWIGMFERDFIAAQVRTGKHCDGVRVALGDFGEYQHAQFKRAPGGIWTRVEEDVLCFRVLSWEDAIEFPVIGEAHGVRGHAEVSMQHVGQPRAGRDPGESESVGFFREGCQ